MLARPARTRLSASIQVDLQFRLTERADGRKGPRRQRPTQVRHKRSASLRAGGELADGLLGSARVSRCIGTSRRSCAYELVNTAKSAVTARPEGEWPCAR